MRHYEIVFLVHPDQSEQVPAMIDRYKEMVSSGSGHTHRIEDWGRRRLAYAINDIHKAHYVMINIECSLDVLREIERNFKFNDSILRHLVIRLNEAVTEESAFSKAKTEEDRMDAEKRKSAESRTANTGSHRQKTEVQEADKETASAESGDDKANNGDDKANNDVTDAEEDK